MSEESNKKTIEQLLAELKTMLKDYDEIKEGQEGTAIITSGESTILEAEASKKINQSLNELVKFIGTKKNAARIVLTKKQLESSKQAPSTYSNVEKCVDELQKLLADNKESRIASAALAVIGAVPAIINAGLAISKVFRADKKTVVVNVEATDKLFTLLAINGFQRPPQDQSAREKLATLDGLLVQTLDEHGSNARVKAMQEWRDSWKGQEQAFFEAYDAAEFLKTNQPYLVVDDLKMDVLIRTTTRAFVGQKIKVYAEAHVLFWFCDATGEIVCASSVAVKPQKGVRGWRMPWKLIETVHKPKAE